MPNQVRIISPRNSAEWDALVRDAVDRKAFGQEHTYFGIENNERADKVRRCIRTAAGHLGVGCKAYWYGCAGCAAGGPDCRFHVSYTIYGMDEARAYKAAMAEQARQQRR